MKTQFMILIGVVLSLSGCGIMDGPSLLSDPLNAGGDGDSSAPPQEAPVSTADPSFPPVPISFSGTKSPSNGTFWQSQYSGGGGTMDSNANVFLYYFGDENTQTHAAYGGWGEGATVVKYDKNGALQWSLSLGLDGSYTEGYGIKPDKDGNVYVTGQTTANLGSTGTHNSRWDVYVAKISPSGSVVWVKTFANSGASLGYGVAADNLGNVYMSGYTFGTGLNGVGPVGNKDAFAMKLDSDGNTVWTKRFGLSSKNASAQSIAVKTDGSAVFIGGVASFNVETDVANPGSNSTGFVMKLDSSGTKVWAKNVGDPSSDVNFYSIIYDQANAVVYAAGYTNVQLTGGTPTGAVTGSKDAVIAKLIDNGTSATLDSVALITGGSGKTSYIYGINANSDYSKIAFGGATSGYIPLDSGSALSDWNAFGGILTTSTMTPSFVAQTGCSTGNRSYAYGGLLDSASNFLMIGSANCDPTTWAAPPSTESYYVKPYDSSGNPL